MTDSRTLKSCPTCFSEIDSRALVCPRCRYPQTRRNAWLRRHWLLTGLLSLILIYAVLGSFGLTMHYLFPSPFNRTDLVPYTNQLTVASSSMFFGEDKNGPVVSIVGVIRNDSDVAWKNVGLEAQYFSPAGGLIDVDTDSFQRYISQVPPHGESAFKIRLLADHPVKDYASYKLAIRSAVDARSW